MGFEYITSASKISFILLSENLNTNTPSILPFSSYVGPEKCKIKMPKLFDSTGISSWYIFP